MLCQCIGPKQKDWATKLPAIKFAMNSARSSTTGFTPFFLNYRQNPSPLVWKGEEVYPGVHQFANNMKEVIMSPHDAVITLRVQHTVQANQKQIPVMFQEGDLVYLSMKNISIPKGHAWCHAWQDIGKNMKHGGDDESNEMMREECGARGDKGKGREEKRETCDQEEEAVKICTGWRLCKYRVRVM